MIHWNPSPEIFQFGPLEPRWYGLFFALAFVFAYQFLKIQVFQKERRPIKDLDSLLLYTVGGTLVGARLGHCLFYEPLYYLSHPIEILMIWKGGLASHGGTLGIIISSYLFTRKNRSYSIWWILDRMSLAIPVVAGMIRLGNLMNSEIYGKETDLPWAFIFDRVDSLPRHPTQLYEAISYFLIFFLMRVFWKKGKHVGEGAILGLLFILIFGVRFFLEFTKVHQADFETGMLLNMGQLLSIPVVIVGIYLFIRSYQREETRRR